MAKGKTFKSDTADEFMELASGQTDTKKPEPKPQTKKSMEDRGWKRATYYLDENLVKTFNKLAAILEKDKSEFANEAFYNLVMKHTDLLDRMDIPHPQNPTED